MNGLSKAIKLAKTKAKHKCHLHAALVLDGNKIVGYGYNYGTTHAEQMAVGQACRWLGVIDLVGYSILSIRVMKSGRLGLAKPCEYCRWLLKKNRIRWMYFSNGLGEIVKERV